MTSYTSKLITALLGFLVLLAFIQQQQQCFTQAKTFTPNGKPQLSAQVFSCELCTKVVKIVQYELTKQSTVNYIENKLNDFCDNLDYRTLRPACHSLVNDVPKLVQLVQQYAEPHAVCAELNMCSSASAIEQVGAGDFKCSACKTVLTLVEKDVANQKNIRKVQKALKKACNSLPGIVEDVCKTLDKELPLIVKRLKQNQTPKKICHEIKLCGNNNDRASTIREQIIEKSQNDNSGEFCQYCHMIYQYVAQQLKDGKVEKEIQQALGEVCSELPSSISGYCVRIKNELPMLIEWILQQYDAQYVCRALGVCSQ